ncbi:integrin alpha-PS2 [Elysia marginata]|uniref:Integrin alpha-PS2 n=1 Tax=Elysia marginata TaxID=1093978 RepID=A0AAV4IAR1_9GAST|nr:integrin alpha-PS2 [Elysia marginata]
MSKRSQHDLAPDLQFAHFWPGGTCGCTSSISTVRDKKAHATNNTNRTERSRNGYRRSKSFPFEACSVEGETASMGGTESSELDCFSSDTEYGSLLLHKNRGARQSLRQFSQLSIAIFAALLVLLTPPAVAFNVDLKSAVIHEGPQNSMFGYAVAQHIDQSTNWVLIGAPRHQTRQPRVERGGAVFRCKTDSRNSCQEVPFDRQGNRGVLVRNRYTQTEEKSNQWLGSTVQSSGENGVIVQDSLLILTQLGGGKFRFDGQYNQPGPMAALGRTGRLQ